MVEQLGLLPKDTILAIDGKAWCVGQRRVTTTEIYMVDVSFGIWVPNTMHVEIECIGDEEIV